MTESKELKCLFLISSTINTVSSTVLGGHKRSMFSTQERFEQTLHTIKSIKGRINNPIIVLLESSQLDEKMKETLSKECTIYVDLSNHSISKYLSESKDKGLSEIYSLRQGMRYVLELGIQFDVLFKLGGRYYLDDKFDISMFDSKSLVFREFSNENFKEDRWFSTMLYGIGWEHRWNYMEALSDILVLRSNNMTPDIEHSIRILLINRPEMKIVDRIGGSGRMAVNGELAEH